MGVFIVILGVAVFVALFAFVTWYFSADARAKRAMKAVPKRTIAEVMEGEQVRIVGRVEVSTPLTAPLTGRACAYWRVLVEQHVSRGKSSYWKTLVDEREGVDFVVDDGTGRALVHTTYSDAVLKRDGSGGSGFMSDPSDTLRAFLSDRGHDTVGWFFNKRIRYREGVAEPGELVAVVGTGHWERDPDAAARAGEGYREAVTPKRLVMDSPDNGPLMLSDEHDVTTV